MDDHPLTEFRNLQKPPLTQEQLAKLLGVTKATVSRWEARRRMPNERILLNISKKTGISVSRLRPDLAIRARMFAGNAA